MNLSANIILVIVVALYHAASVSAQNVAITSGGIAFGTLGDVLLTRQGDTLTSFQDLGTSFNDVSIDADNENLVFALDVNAPRVCSFTLKSAESLVLNNCAGSTISTQPFSGVSARGGTLVVSGGTGGVSIFDYDTATGLLQERVVNEELNVIGFPDVLMISATRAAMSADIGGSPRFGTVILDVDGTELASTREFRIEDSLEFTLVVGPANFPLVNAIYEEASSGAIYMYTANGGMLVQDPNQTGSVVITPFDPNFRAVTVTVNQEKGVVLFGGLVDEQSVIYSYEIVDAQTVTPVGELEVGGRITSIASSGNLVSYVTTTSNTLEILIWDEIMVPPPSSAPNMSPSMAPITSPSMPPIPSPSMAPIPSLTMPPTTSGVSLASMHSALVWTGLVILTICNA